MTALEQPSAPAPNLEESVDALLRDLGTQQDGLGAREAERRLRQYGPNEIRRLERPSRVRELARELVDPLALLLARSDSAAATPASEASSSSFSARE
jgi:magnesium-transporting ATPase (P-type)